MQLVPADCNLARASRSSPPGESKPGIGGWRFARRPAGGRRRARPVTAPGVTDACWRSRPGRSRWRSLRAAAAAARVAARAARAHRRAELGPDALASPARRARPTRAVAGSRPRAPRPRRGASVRGLVVLEERRGFGTACRPRVAAALPRGGAARGRHAVLVRLAQPRGRRAAVREEDELRAPADARHRLGREGGRTQRRARRGARSRCGAPAAERREALARRRRRSVGAERACRGGSSAARARSVAQPVDDARAAVEEDARARRRRRPRSGAGGARAPRQRRRRGADAVLARRPVRAAASLEPRARARVGALRQSATRTHTGTSRAPRGARHQVPHEVGPPAAAGRHDRPDAQRERVVARARCAARKRRSGPPTSRATSASATAATKTSAASGGGDGAAAAIRGSRGRGVGGREGKTGTRARQGLRRPRTRAWMPEAPASVAWPTAPAFSRTRARPRERG